MWLLGLRGGEAHLSYLEADWRESELMTSCLLDSWVSWTGKSKFPDSR